MRRAWNHTKLERARHMKQINEEGLELLVEHAEGLELQAYPDPGSGDKPWTIGYGHTGPDVYKGLIITEATALKLLQSDLLDTERRVDNLVVKANPNQFAALVSFAFNEGVERLRGSTLLRLHNAGDYANAAKEFAKWVYSDGKIMNGLIARRAAEAALYSKGV